MWKFIGFYIGLRRVFMKKSYSFNKRKNFLRIIIGIGWYYNLKYGVYI